MWLQKLQKPGHQQGPKQQQQQQQPEAAQLPSALPAFGPRPWLQQDSRGATPPGSMDQPLRPQPAGDIATTPELPRHYHGLGFAWGRPAGHGSLMSVAC